MTNNRYRGLIKLSIWYLLASSFIALLLASFLFYKINGTERSEAQSNLGNSANLSCQNSKRDITLKPSSATYSQDAQSGKWQYNVKFTVTDTTDWCPEDGECVIGVNEETKVKFAWASCFCEETGTGTQACNQNCFLYSDPSKPVVGSGWPNVSDEYQTVITLKPGQSSDFTATREVTNNCGKFQTDVNVISVNGDTRCIGTSDAYTTYSTSISCTNPPTVTPTPTVTSTPTVTPTPTSTPLSCNLACSNDTQCISGLVCSGGMCRNQSCTNETDCVCNTITPTPTSTPVSCNNSCSPTKACQNGLTCDGGLCRNPSCTEKTNCVCDTPTPTATPTSTPTGDTFLKICKYEDDDADGEKDSGEDVMSWKFKYTIEGEGERVVDSNWWNLFNQGCAKVTVPAGKRITVEEEGRNGWRLTQAYQDGEKVSGGSYTYTSDIDRVKVIWFLNTFTPNDTVSSYCSRIEASTTSGSEPLTVRFTGYGYDSQGSISEYEFDFGDSSGGQPRVWNQKEATAYHRYEAAGNYTAKVKMKDSRGNWLESNACNINISVSAKPQVLGAQTPPVLPKSGASSLILLAVSALLGAGGYKMVRKFRMV